MENHTHCAQNYREQILFLESVYEEERNYQKEEERKKQEALYGRKENKEESKVQESATQNPSGRKVITYKNRI